MSIQTTIKQSFSFVRSILLTNSNLRQEPGSNNITNEISLSPDNK